MTVDEALRLLDLTSPVIEADVEKAYREAVEVWNPDRFYGNQELCAKAELRMQSINEAYQCLTRYIVEESAAREYAAEQVAPPLPKTPSLSLRPPLPALPPQVSTPAKAGRPAAPASSEGEKDLINDKFIFVCCSLVLVGIIAWVIVDRTWVTGKDESSSSSSSYQPAPKVGEESPLIQEEKPTSQEEKKDKERIDFYAMRKAALEGDEVAQTNLGSWYISGRFVEKNRDEGERWLLLATDQGNLEAIKVLAASYMQGSNGFPKNNTLALVFCVLAIENGDEGAQVAVDYLKSVVTPAQLGEATELYNKIVSRLSEAHPVSSVMNERNDEIKRVGAFLDNVARGNIPPKMEEPAPSAPGAPPVEAAPNSSSSHNAPGGSTNEIKKETTREFRIPFGTKPIKITDSGESIGRGATISNEKALGPVYEWTSVEGKRLEAHFISYTDKGVELKVAGTGEIHMIPLTRLSLESRKQADMLNDKVVTDVMEHLPTDHRLQSGFKEVYGRTDGLGKLFIKNGLKEDVLIKLVEDGKLRVTMYVRAQSDTEVWQIPDGNFTVLYCAGYGWKHQKRSFSRGRRAYKLDEPASFSTSYVNPAPEGQGYSLSLSVTGGVDGPVSSNVISADEFDKF